MRYIIILALLLFGVTGHAQNKPGIITKGNNYIENGRGFNFNAGDTINESDTFWIEVTNKQPNAQVYDVWIDLTDVSGPEFNSFLDLW